MFLLDVIPDYPVVPDTPAKESFFDSLAEQDVSLALIAIGVTIVVLLAILIIKKK